MFINAFIVSLTSLNTYSHLILHNFLTKNYNQVDASKQLLDKTDNHSKEKDEGSVREDSSGDIIPISSDNHSRAISDDKMDEGNILDDDNIYEAGEFYE